MHELVSRSTRRIPALAFGLVFQLTDSYRVGIVSLVFFFVVGFFLLLAVPIRRAIVAAGNTPPRPPRSTGSG